MALQTAAIITSIAGYSVTGVDILDADEIKDEVKRRAVPLMMLAPNFFTQPKYIYDAMGTGAVAPITVKYVLRWRFFYAEVGTERGQYDIFQGFIQKVTAIIDAVIANDATSDAIHLQVVDVGTFGVVTDPTGNQFYGCDIGIEVTEYVN